MNLSSIRIFEKIIDKGSSPKDWSNNLSLQLSYTGYSLSNFNLLESHIAQFHIGFKMFLSFFKVLIFLRSQGAKLKMCEWIYFNIRYLKRRKISKVSPRTYIFQRQFLVSLYSVPLIFHRLIFQMWILGKKLGQGEELLFLQVVLIDQVKRYEFISFIKR